MASISNPSPVTLKKRHLPDFGLSLGIAVLLSACANEPNSALERTRSNYQMAAQDASVKNYAATELTEAQKSLQRAERAWEEVEDFDETNHLAYITDRKIELARAQAERLRAQQEMNNLASERDRSRLQTRDSEIQRLQAQLQAKQTPEGILVTLSDVLFDSNRAELKAGSLQRLYPLVQHLREHPETTVKINGYTDDRGNGTYNEGLSSRRAQAVANFLSNNGIDSRRLQTSGMGEEYPIASNATAAGRQQNRRVELTISDAGSDHHVQTE